jgi:hypothetical protein
MALLSAASLIGLLTVAAFSALENCSDSGVTTGAHSQRKKKGGQLAARLQTALKLRERKA